MRNDETGEVATTTELVARAQGIALPADIVSKTLAFIDGLPAEGTASM